MVEKESNNGVSKSNNENRENVPLETALDLTGFGKYNIILLLISSMSMLAVGMDLMSMSFVVPAAACELNLSIEQNGFLTAANMMGLVVMCYPWGYISDTKGRRFTLVVSTTLGFIFAVVASFSTNMVALAVLKFFTGAFSSAAISVTYTMLGEFQPRIYRDRMLYYTASGLMFSGALLAAIAIPTIGMLDFKYRIDFLGIYFSPWRLNLVIIAFPLLLTSISFFFADETPKFLMVKGKSEEALKVLRKIYKINTGKAEDTYPVDSLSIEANEIILCESSFLKSLWIQLSPLLRKPLLKYTIQLYYIQTCLYFVSNMLFLWIPAISIMYLDGLGNMDSAGHGMCAVISSSLKNSTEHEEIDPADCTNTLQIEVPLILIVAALLSAVLNFLLALIIKFTGKKAIILSVLVIGGISGILVGVINNTWIGFALNLILMQVCVIAALIPSYIVELYPTSVRSMAICMSMMIGRTGGMIGANIFGFVVEDYCNELYYFIAFTILSSAAVALFLPGNRVKKNETDVYKL